jgi:hypothetical protein
MTRFEFLLAAHLLMNTALWLGGNDQALTLRTDAWRDCCHFNYTIRSGSSQARDEHGKDFRRIMHVPGSMGGGPAKQ